MRKDIRKEPQKLNLEKIEQEMLQTKLTVPNYNCPGGHPITNICINRNCTSSNSLHCTVSHCPSCTDQHNCSSKSLAQLISLLDQPFADSRTLMLGMRQNLEDAFQRIKRERMKVFQELLWRGKTLPERFEQTVMKLRSNDPEANVTSKQASDLMEKLEELKSTREENKYKVRQLLKNFQVATQKITTQLINLMKDLIQELQDRENNLLSSKVISSENERSIGFIMRSLSSPRNLKLIFRASEHGFSAHKFHQYCDNVSNTLTLIKTNGGKIIGGFTPLKWESPQKQKCIGDPSKKSFLLSVNRLLIMPLSRPSQAIQLDKDWGPIFGGENPDLAIMDKCNQSDGSSFKFPSHYSLDEKLQDLEALSGDPSGSFKVEEYEVFKVYE